MESPHVVHLLKSTGEGEGVFGVPLVARDRLSSRRPGFRFVSILGPTRTGKSYLSNCLVGSERLFDVQNQSCLTTGIDTNDPAVPFAELLRRHELAGAGLPSRPDVDCSEVRFLDTEGMGNREAKYDLKVVLPSIAVSSAVVVNFSGRLGLNKFLDEVGSLAYACKALLRQQRKVAEVLKGPGASGAKVPLLGHLHIVFRNWTNASSPEEYRNYLFEEYPEGVPEEEEERIKLARGDIKDAFSSVTVHTFPFPCPAEVIKAHASIPFAMLSREFVGAVHGLVAAVAAQLAKPPAHRLAPLVATEAAAVDFLGALASTIGDSGVLEFPTVMQALYRAACERARTAALERARLSARLPPPPVNAGKLAAALRRAAAACVAAYEEEAAAAGVPEAERAAGRAPLDRELEQWGKEATGANVAALRAYFEKEVAAARAELRRRAVALRDGPELVEAELKTTAATWAEELVDGMSLRAGERGIVVPEDDPEAGECAEVARAVETIYNAAQDEGLVLVQVMAAKRDAAASKALAEAERALRQAVERLPLPMGAAALDAALAAARKSAAGASPPPQLAPLADAIEADARSRNALAAASALQAAVHKALRSAQAALGAEDWSKVEKESEAKGVAGGIAARAREAFARAGHAADMPGLEAARAALEEELQQEAAGALRAWGRERAEAERAAQHRGEVEKLVKGIEQMKVENQRLSESMQKMADEGQKRLQRLESSISEAAQAQAMAARMAMVGGGGGGGGWDMCSYERPSGGGRSSGSCGGRTIYTGPRGGRYYINGNGNKTYLRKK